MRHITWATVVSGLVCAIGCGSRDSRLEAQTTVVDVQSLGSDLAYVQSSGVLQRVNVMSDAPKPQTTKSNIRSGPFFLAKRPQPALGSVPEELLILSNGVTDAHEQVIEKPALTAVNVANEQRVYNLSQPQQLMRLSEDGRYAVLFDDPATSSSNSLLTNKNEIAIVDLSKDPSEGASGNPTIRTLDAVGGAPQNVWFANLANIGNFVLFSFPKGVSLRQLDVPDDPGNKIELKDWVPSSGSAPVADVQFDPDTTNGDVRKIYLRNDSSPDVQVISVTKDKDTGSIGVSQNTLNVGATAPGDFYVYSVSSSTDDTALPTVSTRLLATVGRQVAVVAADSNTVTTVPLTYGAKRIVPFLGTSPKDNAIKQRAVLYAPDQSGVTFVDLEDLELKTTKAVQAVDLGVSVGSVLRLDGVPNSLVLVMKSGGVEVLDLEARRWSPFGSSIPLTTSMADPSLYRTWVAASGEHKVGYVDFGDPKTGTVSLSIGKISLDDPIQKLFRIDSGLTRRAIVTHDRLGGALTIFDAVNPERATSNKLEGFLFSDLL